MASKASVKPQTLRRQDQLLITNDGRKNSFDYHSAVPCSSSTTYCCKSHNSQAFDKLNEMRRNRHLTDIVLVVGNQRINAHRVVLAACSSYFRQMFTSSDQSQQGISLALRLIIFELCILRNRHTRYRRKRPIVVDQLLLHIANRHRRM